MLFFVFQPLHAGRGVQMDTEESNLCYLSESALLATQLSTQLSMHIPLAISRTHSLPHTSPHPTQSPGSLGFAQLSSSSLSPDEAFCDLVTYKLKDCLSALNIHWWQRRIKTLQKGRE